jgi:DNA-directed RNA polymerase specialized sigma24 family protein
MSRNGKLAAYLYMPTHQKAGLEVEVQRMVDERFPEGLVRVLAKDFPSANHADYEDAVSTGFEKLVVKGPTYNPQGYVTTVAVNAMKRMLRRATFEQLAVEDDDEPPVDIWFDPTLNDAITENAFAFMRELVDRWESRNLKTTTLLLIEAGKLAEPLSSAELSERLEELLGQDVLPDTARQWRKRGLDRLRGELVAAELLDETEMS